MWDSDPQHFSCTDTCNVFIAKHGTCILLICPFGCQADNRKRYKEETTDHQDDNKAADLAWEKHKRLNESIIVALFQGQFKSTVQCLTCHRKSRTFEAFMYLSLPLASSNKCTLQVTKHMVKKNNLIVGVKWKASRQGTLLSNWCCLCPTTSRKRLWQKYSK